jgi:Fe-S-cluster-containing hydrogenase component 2
MLTVLDEACNACVKTHYLVTNGCQACIARPCMMNCAKKAITIHNHRAVIDKEKCVNCGKCAQACQFSAIRNYTRPCQAACKVNAITINEDQSAKIDDEKC